MFCDVKDLIKMQNIMFKDNGRLDLSLYGHPILIISKNEDEGYFYYLTVSSSSDKTDKTNPYQHYLLKRDGINRLRSPLNYVNLKNIYKTQIKGYVPMGSVYDKEFDKIITALQYYQEDFRAVPDEFYSEVFHSKRI